MRQRSMLGRMPEESFQYCMYESAPGAEYVSRLGQPVDHPVFEKTGTVFEVGCSRWGQGDRRKNVCLGFRHSLRHALDFARFRRRHLSHVGSLGSGADRARDYAGGWGKKSPNRAVWPEHVPDRACRLAILPFRLVPLPGGGPGSSSHGGGSGRRTSCCGRGSASERTPC